MDALKFRKVLGGKAWRDTVALGSKRFQERAVEGRR